MELRGQFSSCLFCAILLTVIPCSGQKYQGWTALLKNGFTTGHVSLELKNVHPAERLQNGAVHSPNEWSNEVATKLQIAETPEKSSEFKNGETLSEKGKKTVRFANPETPEKSTETPEKSSEFKNGETLREKAKKRVRDSLPETSEKSTQFKNGETLREKGKKRVRDSLPETSEKSTRQKYQGRTVLLKNGFTTGNVSLKLKNVQPADRLHNAAVHSPNEWSTEVATELQIAETPEKSTENMVKAILVLLLGMIIIGIIFFIYYCCRNRSRDPEKGRLLSPEEGRYGPGVDESQSQGRLQKEKDELQTELRRLQKEKEDLQGKLDWRMIYKYADNITFDAGTAHPNLSISGDQKSLKHEAQPQNVSPNPERFDSTVCVLGSEGFCSGKHYWEVDVVSSTDWDLGMARKSIQRKGKLSLSPKEGFWALGLSGRDYWAKTDPWTRVMVQKKPKKIGVYLSYQDGQVTFCNVTDMSVLFTFNDCSFSGEVYPFFKNSHKETTMRICSIREDE